ncbi:MAG: MBL fold metallo-hydrolase, partial [Acidiferrobacterales bacterium]
MRINFILLLLALNLPAAYGAQCPDKGLQLQVLGSGGSSLSPGRAGPGYIIWYQGHARILVDIGPGTAIRFRETGARFADLETLLLTQVDSAHTADLAALMSSAVNGDRLRPLPIYGPVASKTTPSTVSFVRSLFDQKRGAFRDLGSLVSPLGTQTFKLKPHNTSVVSKKKVTGENKNTNIPVFSNAIFKIYNFNASDKKGEKLGWLIKAGGKNIVLIGDAQPNTKNLKDFTNNADILVVHHAIPESGPNSAKNNFLSPSAIGSIAYKAQTRQLVLGHRRFVTLGKEKETTAEIKSKFSGLVHFANDLDCFTP